MADSDSGHREVKLQRVVGVRLADARSYPIGLCLAVGHSARDTFAMLASRARYVVYYRSGPGFLCRDSGPSVSEHPQTMVPTSAFCAHRPSTYWPLPSTSLSITGSNGRTVYSFCMCPRGPGGGRRSETGHVVTNGMVQHSRNERKCQHGNRCGAELSEPGSIRLWPRGSPQS